MALLRDQKSQVCQDGRDRSQSALVDVSEKSVGCLYRDQTYLPLLGLINHAASGTRYGQRLWPTAADYHSAYPGAGFRVKTGGGG